MQITKWGYRDGLKRTGDKIRVDYTRGLYNKTSPVLSYRATLYSEGEKVESFWQHCLNPESSSNLMRQYRACFVDSQACNVILSFILLHHVFIRHPYTPLIFSFTCLLPFFNSIMMFVHLHVNYIANQ